MAAAAPTIRPVGFSGTLASEWIKVTSIRSTYITLGLGIVLSLGVSALVAVIIGATYGDWNASDQASFDPVISSLAGAVLGAIVLTVLGVNLIASEYSSGMIRVTLTATPRRWRVLAAKLMVVTAITFVAGTVLFIASYWLSQAIFSANDVPTVGVGDSDALRMVVASSLLSPVFPVVGATLAILLRSTAGAITTVMGILFAPAIFGGLLPQWWQENVLSLLPASANDAISIGHLGEGSAMYLDLGPAIIVVAGWMVIFIAAAQVVLSRRDA